MIELRKTAEYDRWFRDLQDDAQGKIQLRIDRLEAGNPGDPKAVGRGVFEMRIHWGPGYRVYFAWQGRTCILLLAGGDKGSQERDIRCALRLASKL